MQDMLDAAVSAGVSEVSVQYRIKADAQHLSTAAERSAYLLGLRAAFLTIAKPTFPPIIIFILTAASITGQDAIVACTTDVAPPFQAAGTADKCCNRREHRR